MEKKDTTLTDLVLHGHFYQPPRENPLVELIPLQNSAKPYADWNEKIYDDCYRANAFSRYLDRYALVRDIVNNYEYISFNFGPTLLNWMEKYHGQTYEMILEADRASLKRLGHGNAIAQAYNHTILPLGNKEDAKTQIMWGIEDFVRRFKREPEGMWLAETAISDWVVTLLAEANIKFVILSPWQCLAAEKSDGTFKNVDGNTLAYQYPYILKGSDGGSLTAFFYNPDLASSISFGHMLRDADKMYETLIEIKTQKNPLLLHTATDGEIYGHHEPYGDMALAALIRKVKEGSLFNFTNYGSFLEKHKPTRRALLQLGEERKGSSWSCSHGVSRWYKDCGCHTGGEKGWNQKWRTPLREAFDLLADRIDKIYEKEVKILLKGKAEPIELLRDYSKVIGEALSVEEYIKEWEERLSIKIKDKRRLAELLEGQKLKHFIYTSCGWFFSDISGIEPRQNLFYAVRAIKLYQRYTAENLEDLVFKVLAEAKSNKKSEGNGRTIAKSYTEHVSGEAEATAYFLMNRNFALPPDYKTEYGKYRLLEYEQIEEFKFSCKVLDTKTLRSDTALMEVVVEPDYGYTVYMELTDETTKEQFKSTFTTSDIPPRMLQEVYSWIDHSLSQISDEELHNIATGIRHYSLLAKKGQSAAKETMYIENMGTCLRALRSLFTTPDTLPWEEKRESISHLLGFIKRKGQKYEHSIVENIFTNEIEKVAQKINDSGFSYDKGSYILELLKVADEQNIGVSTTLAQESLFPYIKGAMRSKLQSPLTVDVIENLRVALNFSVED
jgi:hypothetical protein